VSLGFWGVYLRRRSFWWAVIPGGVLATLATVAATGSLVPGTFSGAVFFAGMAATFVLVALLPSEGGPRQWAFVPAVVLAALALITLTDRPEALNIGWPLVLIALGMLVLFRTWRRPEPGPDQPHHRPL
jgi:hypothetical protein